jgi:hypothetical protein
MSRAAFVPGKLKLKTTKPKSAALKEKTVPPPTNPPHPSVPVDADPEPIAEIVGTLTEAEAKFLAVNNQYKKRMIEMRSGSFNEERERFNEHLKRAPMHNDLEGE